MQKIIFILSIVLFFSCKEKKDTNVVYQYFDSNKFVQLEIENILNENASVTKEITLNGIKEFKKIETIDSLFLYNEFSFIAAANINKPALYGKYETDTFALNARNEQGLDLIHYTYTLKDSTNRKLKTKMLSSIHNIETKDVVGCLFHLESKNFMHSFSKDIYYEMNKGIRVDAWEKTLFQDTIYYSTNLKLNNSNF